MPVGTLDSDYRDDGVIKCSNCHWEIYACSCELSERRRELPGESDQSSERRRELPGESDQSSIATASVVLQSRGDFHDRLSELRESDLFCDLIVLVEEREFRCHRLVLWCTSHYFRYLFAAGMSDSNSSQVKLEEISSRHFEKYLEFSYLGSCTVDRDDVEALTQMAARLQSSHFKSACVDVLKSDITYDTWIDALAFADRLCLPDLRFHALRFAATQASRGTLKLGMLNLSHLQDIAQFATDQALLVKLCRGCGRRPVSESELALLQSLLETETAHVNEVDAGRVSSLFEASYFGNRPLVEFLLAQGADTDLSDADGNSPLFIASQEGHAGCVEALLGAGADVDQPEKHGATPLFVAVQQDENSVVARLLKACADPDRARQYDQMTPLYLACRKGFATSARLLLEAGASPNFQGKDALTVAIKKSNVQCVKLLLEQCSCTDRHMHLAFSWTANQAGKEILNLVQCAHQEAQDVKETVERLIEQLEEEDKLRNQAMLFEGLSLSDRCGSSYMMESGCTSCAQSDVDREDHYDGCVEQSLQASEGTAVADPASGHVASPAHSQIPDEGLVPPIQEQPKVLKRRRMIRKRAAPAGKRSMRALIAMAKLLPRCR